jgi:glycosyltransferase involved in cell wall biosynthesis
MDNVEYIFVDDCTPDESINIVRRTLEDYPARKAAVTILSHEKNRGLPTARNTGLRQAKGEYIYHCDSDDYVDKTALEEMYNAAVSHDSDAVYTDFYLTFGGNERYMHQPEYTTPDACLRAMLSGTMKYNVWNKIIRRSIYVVNVLRFLDGLNMGEDMTILALFAEVSSVCYLPKAYYHYTRTNAEAYTRIPTLKQLGQINENATTNMAFIEEVYDKPLDKEFAFFKLTIKLPLLISADKNSYDLWNNWFTEANAYIAESPAFTLRTRLIQYAAMRHWYWYIRLYYYLFHRVIYGLIYR